jgi:predicted nucleic acid-binding protein
VKVLLDADVLLDIALNREPFFKESSAVVEWCQEAPQTALIAWHSVSNLYYLLRAARTDAKARNFVSDMLRFANVASGGTEAVRRALTMPMNDFEDALQVAAAISEETQFIITRNVSHYRGSLVPVLTPNEFLRRFVVK